MASSPSSHFLKSVKNSDIFIPLHCRKCLPPEFPRDYFNIRWFSVQITIDPARIGIGVKRLLSPVADLNLNPVFARLHHEHMMFRAFDDRSEDPSPGGGFRSNLQPFGD